MTDPRQHVEAQLEAQRWQAQQASREQPAQVAWHNALETAADHFMAGRWAQARRVLEIAREALS